MFVPRAFAVDDPDALAMLRSTRFGHLVTVAERLESTPIPIVLDAENTYVLMHVARANDHWRTADGRDALLIAPGGDAYVSPRWYPSKAEHGRVVPTWNYEVVHVHGVLEVIDDADSKLTIVKALTDRNERLVAGGESWGVDDAPPEFVQAQLRGIVGLRLRIGRIEGKRKLSQNRPDADRLGAANGVASGGDPDLAARMRPIDPD